MTTIMCSTHGKPSHSIAPPQVYMRAAHIKFYTVDAKKLAINTPLGNPYPHVLKFPWKSCSKS